VLLSDTRLSQVFERQSCGKQDADHDQGNEHGAVGHEIGCLFMRAVPAFWMVRRRTGTALSGVKGSTPLE
jgi:hypothetical protein